ncbi:MAG TPA: type II toxin-antitoxin system RelE/ParE family toxin [Gemmatimonadaceae bacterium]|jgi:plasmid stabilization system protein ParE
MTPRFVFRPAARADLRAAREWYADQQAGLALELRDMVDVTLADIGEYPERYAEIDPGIRRAVLGKFPYAIFYRIRTDNIEILAVLHHRRDPLVWRSRASL